MEMKKGILFLCAVFLLFSCVSVHREYLSFDMADGSGSYAVVYERFGKEDNYHLLQLSLDEAMKIFTSLFVGFHYRLDAESSKYAFYTDYTHRIPFSSLTLEVMIDGETFTVEEPYCNSWSGVGMAAPQYELCWFTVNDEILGKLRSADRVTLSYNGYVFDLNPQKIAAIKSFILETEGYEFESFPYGHEPE